MHWALDGEVAGLAAVVVPARATPTRSPRCSRVCNDAPGAGHRRRRAAAACAARACPCSAASCSTCAAWPASSTSTTTSLVLDVLPGTFGAPLRGRAARRARPDARPLAAVDRPLDRRRLAGLPRRRPVLDPLREDRGHGRRPRGRARRRQEISHRRRAPAAVGPRPHPAVRRLRGHARRHHRRPAARPPGAAGASGEPRTASRSFDDGLDACRRILRRGATPAVLRLYDDDRSRTQLPDRRPPRAARARRGRPGARRRDDGDRRRGVRRAGGERARRRASSSSGSSTATTCPRSRR